MEMLDRNETILQVKGDNLKIELKNRKDALNAITGCSTCNSRFDTNELEMDANYKAVSFTAFLFLWRELTLLVHFMPNLPMPS